MSESGNKGPGDVPGSRINKTRKCCSAATPGTLKVICGILVVMGLLEIGTLAWVLSQMPWDGKDAMNLDLEERLLANKILLMKAVCVGTILFGLLRIAFIFCLYISRSEEPTLAKVCLGRACFIIASTSITITLIALLTLSADEPLLTILGVTKFMFIGFLIIDLIILFSYGVYVRVTVVDLYRLRRYHLRRPEDPATTARVNAWARRNNDKYKHTKTEESAEEHL